MICNKSIYCISTIYSRKIASFIDHQNSYVFLTIDYKQKNKSTIQDSSGKSSFLSIL